MQTLLGGPVLAGVASAQSAANVTAACRSGSLVIMRSTMLLIVLMSLGCSDASAPPPVAAVQAIPALSVYSEFESLDAVSARLPALAAHGLGLIRLVRPEEIGQATLASFFIEAARSGIATRAWIVLSKDDGYWPNEANLERYAETIDAFLA